jgi:hypothetical protein
VLEAFHDIKEKLQVPFAVEIIIFASLVIWMIRNDKNFREIPSFQRWKDIFS